MKNHTRLFKALALQMLFINCAHELYFIIFLEKIIIFVLPNVFATVSLYSKEFEFVMASLSLDRTRISALTLCL